MTLQCRNSKRKNYIIDWYMKQKYRIRAFHIVIKVGDIRWVAWLREKGRGVRSQVWSHLLTKLTFADKNKNIVMKVEIKMQSIDAWRTYSVDLPAAVNKSAQCRPSVFLATLTTTSRYSGKFLIRSQVFSKRDLLAWLTTEIWFLFTFGLE